MIEQRPLVIGLPGSFDAATYSSYCSWAQCLSELGTDVRILDMLQLPGVRQIDCDNDGNMYYCDWQPEDYLKLILSTINTLSPSKIVLLGFGSGAYEAIRSAYALSILGYPVSGVIGVAPHTLMYRPDMHREFLDLPKRLATEVELRAKAVSSLCKDIGSPYAGDLLSCVRYEDLRTPHNGSRSVFYVSQTVLDRSYEPLSVTLGKVRFADGNDSFKVSELLGSPKYKIPTAFVTPGDSWYLPPAKVRAFARRSNVPASFNEITEVCYDFRAYPSQVDHVTEVVMDKVGQILATGTASRPRPQRTLLLHSTVDAEQPMGTIVLSSARSTNCHKDALRLAKASNTNLLVLASHNLDYKVVADDMKKDGVKGYVVEVPDRYCVPLTADFVTQVHPKTIDRTSNLSAKRNLGLLYGRLTGRKIFFIDDDIRGVQPEQLQRAAAQLDHHAVVGFMASDYPDNSAVCHANRLVKNVQDIFISGSALGVDPAKVGSFFPNIYNEDWLFCYDTVRKCDAVLSGSVQQLPYNPFDPRRAVLEEFGDVLAEGLQYLLTIGMSYEVADEPFWRYYLLRRRTFIANIAKGLAALPHSGDTQVEQALATLESSRDVLSTFIPSDFVTYIHNWRSDIRFWKKRVDSLHRQLPRTEMIFALTEETGITFHAIDAL